MCLCLSECACLVLVPAGVLCLCRADITMPIGPITLKQDTTHTSHRTLCHQGTSHRHGSTAPTAAPARWDGTNNTKRTDSEMFQTQSTIPEHTHAHIYPPNQASPSAAEMTPRPAHTGPGEWRKAGPRSLCGHGWLFLLPVNSLGRE